MCSNTNSGVFAYRREDSHVLSTPTVGYLYIGERTVMCSNTNSGVFVYRREDSHVLSTPTVGYLYIGERTVTCSQHQQWGICI